MDHRTPHLIIGTVLANAKLKRQLVKFAKQYPVHVNTRTAPLLFSAKGGGFTAQTIVNLFKRIYKLAGIDGASSHIGRRQFVLNSGINLIVKTQHYFLSCFYIISLSCLNQSFAIGKC